MILKPKNNVLVLLKMAVVMHGNYQIVYYYFIVSVFDHGSFGWKRILMTQLLKVPFLCGK